MHLYSLEFFIDKLNLGSDKLNEPDMDILVTISDLLNFRIEYKMKLSAYNALIKSTGSGKAVFFPSTSISRLVTAFTSEIKVVVVEVSEGVEEYAANGAIKWSGNFEKAADSLKEQNDHIECEVKHPLFKDDKQIGSISVQMCLVYFGDSIEIPIAYMGSQLSVPMSFRRKEPLKKVGTEKRVSSSTEAGWAPLFVSPKKQTKSIMDPSMEIYAEMSGIPVPPPVKSLLTPDYINKTLCTHKFCPGAKKFKEFGLGPLAQPGSCLGTVNSIKEVKPYGLYGMSQAYGTMDGYGAYGLFVKKSEKKRKSCCGSPDCPYTALYGMPLELPEGEDMPPIPTINEVINKPKKCQCKNCKKHNGSNGSKHSSKNSTCASPSCPKKAPTSGVPCPYRQSAGADKWSPSPCCKSQACPFSSGSSFPSSSGGRQGGVCGGALCPAKPGDCAGPSCTMDSCEEESKKKCGGRQCPFHSNGSPGECPTGTCPHIGCGKGDRRKSRPSEQPAMLDELNSFLDKTASVSEKKKNCRDKTCPYYEEGEGEDETTKNCEDKTCPANQERGSSREFEEKYGLCGGQVCPLKTNIDDPLEDVPDTTTAKQKKRLSLLLNEDGQKMLLGKDDLNNTEMFANLKVSEQSDMVLMISRLLEQRQRSHSLNNYYNPELSLSMQNFVSTMRLRSFDSGKSGPKENLSSEKLSSEKKKRKGPCSQDSCKSLKYKRCSECGGISKSGATCDNTDVSFSTISYDSATTTGAGDQTLMPKPGVPIIQSVKKKIINKEEMSVKIAKTKKRNSRFVYHAGEAYPGVRLGHKTCVYGSKNVPANMGWLWNIRNEGEKRRRKKKWKPGYLRKEIEEAIIANRRRKGIPDPPELKMLVRKSKNRNAAYESDSDEEEVIPKPTLIIQKKEGNYLITMHPLKDPKKLEDREDPYMRCKPIQFVITKPPKKVPDPLITGYDEIEGEYDEEDFENFYKNSCYCDGDPNLDSTSSSESELNIEFTTPAGIIIPERFKKPPNVVNVNTQFRDTDFQCSDCPIIVPKKFKKERSPRKKKAAP